MVSGVDTVVGVIDTVGDAPTVIVKLMALLSQSYLNLHPLLHHRIEIMARRELL